MKNRIIVHTTARLDWSQYDEKIMIYFLKNYWGVYDHDLSKFFLNMSGVEACKVLFKIATKFKKAWKGFGYSRIIEKDGNIEALTHYLENTNGAAGFNSTAIHISWDGGIEINPDTLELTEVDNRTDLQKAGLYNEIYNIINCSKSIEEINIKSIDGHRDLDPRKSCPLFNAKKEYQWILK